jgi:aarF domain-containing kinase
MNRDNSFSNNRVPKTTVIQGSGNDLVERTQFVKPESNGNNSKENGRVMKTQIVSGANSNDLVERTQFVDDNNSETSLSMDDITDMLQSLSGLTQYLPLLSVVPELPFRARQQAVFLPAELAGRVASRVAARTIRGALPRNGSSQYSYKDQN